MGALAAIGGWIAERESLLSGTAAIIVLLVVLGSAITYLYRRFTDKPGDEPATTEEHTGVSVTLKDLTAPAPYPVHFAESDGLRVAYTTLGEGASDIVVAPGIISHLNISCHLPPLRDSVAALNQFARVLLFDKKGCRLSRYMSHSCRTKPPASRRFSALYRLTGNKNSRATA